MHLTANNNDMWLWWWWSRSVCRRCLAFI